jgi:pimeloyl-ACP methyl ester carboxylesterase
MSATGSLSRSQVLLVPGGASTVHGYFPQLGTALDARAQVIQINLAGIGPAHDRRPLRLPEYARGLAQAVRTQADGPLIIVGHSLGGLVALRLAIDEPGLAAALLLLDPTPPTPPAMLHGMALFLRALATLGPAGQRLWDRRARHDLRGITMDDDQARALAVYTDPRFAAETARWARYLARDGAALAEDLAAGKLPPVPAIVVSAGYHRPRSAVRRAHQQLAAWIPRAELQVWDGAPHPLHIQQPQRVAAAVSTLLEQAANRQLAGR